MLLMHVVLPQQQEDRHPPLPNDAILINQKRFQKYLIVFLIYAKKGSIYIMPNTSSFPLHFAYIL